MHAISVVYMLGVVGLLLGSPPPSLRLSARRSGGSAVQNTDVRGDANFTRQTLDIALGAPVLPPDFNDWLKKAGEVSADLTKTAGIIKEVNPRLLSVVTMLTDLGKVSPIISVVGSVLGLFGLLSPAPAPFQEVITQLNEIQSAMGNIQGQITAWFQAVMGEVHTEACYTRYSAAEAKMSQAVRVMHDYVANPSDGTKADLINTCQTGNVCDEMIASLLQALNGDTGAFGCDLMEIAGAGNLQTAFFKGSPDYFRANIGYLLVLVSQGIQAQAMFETLSNSDGSAWKRVSQQYSGDLQSAVQRMQDQHTQITSDVPTNIGTSVESYVARLGGSTANKDLIYGLVELLQSNYRSFKFFGMVVTDTGDKNLCSYPKGSSKWSYEVAGTAGKNLYILWAPIKPRSENPQGVLDGNPQRVYGAYDQMSNLAKGGGASPTDLRDCAATTETAQNNGVQGAGWFPDTQQSDYAQHLTMGADGESWDNWLVTMGAGDDNYEHGRQVFLVWSP